MIKNVFSYKILVFYKVALLPLHFCQPWRCALTAMPGIWLVRDIILATAKMHYSFPNCTYKHSLVSINIKQPLINIWEWFFFSRRILYHIYVLYAFLCQIPFFQTATPTACNNVKNNCRLLAGTFILCCHTTNWCIGSITSGAIIIYMKWSSELSELTEYIKILLQQKIQT